MKIVIFETEPWERDTFEELNKNHDVITLEEPLSKDNAGNYRDADIISTFIYSKLSEEELEQFAQLKMIATRSTGISHIDREYCKNNGIMMSNVPTYGKNTVAEHAFGLILAISHNIVAGGNRTRNGQFNFKGLRGFDLRGKALGVIGTGDIGEHVIKVALGFEMCVLAFDVKPRPELKEHLNFEYVDMDTLLEKSDIITIHVPGIPQTRNMISREQFEKMKDGVVLINTSRGSVIDVQALTRALNDGKVKAAGLDVLPEEPIIHEEAELLRSVYTDKNEKELSSLLADNALMNMDNVIVTPHSAFFTTEAIQRILRTTVENITGFIEGNPKNKVE